jgi:transcription initiation factor TFIID TATA-box-binding protein
MAFVGVHKNCVHRFPILEVSYIIAWIALIYIRVYTLANLPMSTSSDDLPKLTIQNIVATFIMCKQKNKFSLYEMTSKLPFVEFNAKRFAAAIIRLLHPQTTCLFFASGKGVCTGARSEDEARLSALKHVTLLQSAGLPVEFLNFSVQNIVSVAHCPFAIDLVRLAESQSGLVGYEPDLFPGLSFRLPYDRETGDPCTVHKLTVVVLVFQSGKCVITGLKSQVASMKVWKHFYFHVIHRFKASYNEGSSGNYRLSQKFDSLDTHTVNTIKDLLNSAQHQTHTPKHAIKRKKSDVANPDTKTLCYSESKQVKRMCDFVLRPMAPDSRQHTYYSPCTNNTNLSK